MVSGPKSTGNVVAFSQEVSALNRARRMALITRLLNVFTWSVIVVLTLLWVGYHSVLSGLITYANGDVSLSWWSCVGVGVFTVLGLLSPVVWSWLRFNPAHIYQRLERALSERGLASEADIGLLTTLSTELGLASYTSQFIPLIRSSRSSASLKGSQIDHAMLILIARRARPLLQALPKVTSRPAWELSGLTLCCALWVMPTIHVEHDEIRRSRVAQVSVVNPLSPAIRQVANQDLPRRPPESPQFKSSQADTSQRDIAQATSLNEFTQSSQRRSSKQSSDPKNADDQKRSTQKRRLTSPQNSAQPLQKISKARAQRGGRVSSGDAESTAPHQQMQLTTPPRPLSSDVDLKSDRRRASRPQKRRGSITAEVRPLSIAESADFYGISAQLSSRDFPPQLRLNEIEDVYAK